MGTNFEREAAQTSVYYNEIPVATIRRNSSKDWELAYTSGRREWFDTFAEAKDESQKIMASRDAKGHAVLF